MGKIIIEIRGFKSEAILDDEVAEKVYKALPSFELKKGQTTLSEVKLPKPEERLPAQKPLLPKEGIKYPTNEEVRDFIKTIPNYEFSLPLICNHFIGFTPISKIGDIERRTYDRMWNRIRKAKKLIANEENGEWIPTTGEKGETIYTFVKISMTEA